MAKYCTGCGNPSSALNKFCPHCGTSANGLPAPVGASVTTSKKPVRLRFPNGRQEGIDDSSEDATDADHVPVIDSLEVTLEDLGDMSEVGYGSKKFKGSDLFPPNL